MPQLNLPKKYTAMGQLWLSVLLIVLAVIFAFTPIVSLNMSESSLWDGVQTAGDALADKIPAFANLEKPEDEIGVTSLKVITSVSILTKIVSIAISSAQNDETAQEKAEDLEETLASEEGKEAVIMMIAIVAQLIDFEDAFEDAPAADAEDEEKEEGNSGIGAVIQTIIKVIIVLYLLAYVTVWPFVLLVIGIINVIRALQNINTPEKVAGKVGGVLVAPFAFSLTLSFLLTFLPGFEWGSGLTVIFVCSIICIVANIVMTRLRAYNELDFKYVNLVQGAALLQGIGFIVFFTNLLATNILYDFFNALGNYMYTAGLEVSAINRGISDYNSLAYEFGLPRAEYATLGSAFLPDLLLMILFMALAISVIASVIKAVINRLSLTEGKGNLKAPLTSSIMALVVAILPLIVSSLESARHFEGTTAANGAPSFIAKKAGTIFELSAENSSAVTGMIIGAAIMLIAAIAFMVLKNMFCAEITEGQELKVLAGQADEFAPVAKAAATEEAAAPAEEAPAAEETKADEE